eukprot:SAG31_NODE_32_length_32319_cov_28.042681_1_plen_69_part_00
MPRSLACSGTVHDSLRLFDVVAGQVMPSDPHRDHEHCSREKGHMHVLLVHTVSGGAAAFVELYFDQLS